MGIRSFKAKLVVYFVLLALVPLAAALWGFDGVIRRSETRRVDARLQAELRAALTTYQDDLLAATARARRLGRDADFQDALRRHDGDALELVVRGIPNLRVDAGSLHVGAIPPFSAVRSVSAVANGKALGRATIGVPLDRDLLSHLSARAGLGREDRLAVLRRGRLVHGPESMRGESLSAPAGEATVVTVGGERLRTLVARLPEPVGAALAIVSPQSRVRRPRFAGHSGGQRDHAAAAASARRYSRASVGVR